MMRQLVVLTIFGLVFSSCAPLATPTPASAAFVDLQHPEEIQQATPSPFAPTATAAAALIATPRVMDVSLWAPAYLAESLGDALEEPLRALFVPDAAQASLHLEVGTQNVVSEWIYALVTPFSSTLPGIQSAELLGRWQSGPAGGQPLLMDSNTYDMLGAAWGPAGEGSVQILAAGELVEAAWAQGDALAIVPFEALEPRWKVLPVDGLSPLRKDFVAESYALKVPVSLSAPDGSPELVALIRSNFAIPSSNRDPQKLTVLALTGVTALVRATAYEMQQHGVTYPAQDIRGWLLDADITHISNEVPFAEDCPDPNPRQPDVRFCSQDHTIQLLEDIEADVVELTGDHFQDWGTDAMFHTLEMYRARGWQVYGGGADLTEGRKALLLEDHGNRIAFIGCNAKGGSFAQAGEAQPGAVACDMDWMAGEVSRLAAEGYLVIATFQHHEYYTYAAQPDQQRDFRQMAQAGAVIVSGSQAHQPQGMEFLNGSFIHYGLGNLFFDQYGLCPACEQGLIDRHVFYAGRFIGTELLPIQFVDYARSRPMTDDEADALFEALFEASGW
jgi:poly-gamma-glutamate synthesis protein (capsule biosynthesis protein)